MNRQLILVLCLLFSSHSFASRVCQELFYYEPIVNHYEHLEAKGNKQTESWVKAQVRRTKVALKEMNYKGVAKLFRGIMDKPSNQSWFTLPNQEVISLRDKGLFRSKDVIVTKPDGSIEVLFSNKNWMKGDVINFNFVDKTLSADKRYLSVTAAVNGTIDEFKVILYDLQTKTLLTDELTKKPLRRALLQDKHDTQVAWLSNTQFALASDTGVHIYDIKNDKVFLNRKEDSNISVTQNGLSILSNSGVQTIYQDGFPILTLSFDTPMEVASVVGSDLYLLTVGEGQWGQIMKVSRDPQDLTKAQSTIVMPETNWVTNKVSKLDDQTIALHRYLGPDRRIDILDLKTQSIAQSISIPGSSALTSVQWAVPGSQVKLTLSSPIIKSRTFTYDFSSKSYLEGNPEIEMMTLNGVQYATEYRFYPSKDGVMIPVRLVYKKAFAKDGSSAGLGWTYGGFNLLGYLHPSYNDFNLQYLQRGGVLFAPGVRGGAEYGPSWHEGGMLANRINAENDLNAVVEGLQKDKYIDPKKTISTGWSNGGTVTASAALQRPDLYGGVIPGAGVHDSNNAIFLDPEEQGWKEEQGDPRTPDILYMNDTSPVELAVSGAGAGPMWLVMVGLNDSRVNQAHSKKVTNALLRNSGDPDKVHMMAYRAAGHWMTSQMYQDSLAWLSQSAIYSFIFAVSGMAP